MTKEEALEFIGQSIKPDVDMAKVADAIKALEQEPCENAISRQDVLDLAKKGVLISNGSYKSVCKAINDLPSVTPQPKTGYWIKSRDCYGNNHFTCPFCENDIATKYDGAWKDNYCSNCGARMQEVE